MTEDKQAAERPKKAERKTPKQWAEALGHFTKHGRGPMARVLPTAEYATANVLYGWSKQAHHWGPDSLKLTRTDFEAAMAASSKYPTVRPHEPAISRVYQDSGRFKDFIPLKAHKESK